MSEKFVHRVTRYRALLFAPVLLMLVIYCLNLAGMEISSLPSLYAYVMFWCLFSALIFSYQYFLGKAYLDWSISTSRSFTLNAVIPVVLYSFFAVGLFIECLNWLLKYGVHADEAMSLGAPVRNVFSPIVNLLFLQSFVALFLNYHTIGKVMAKNNDFEKKQIRERYYSPMRSTSISFFVVLVALFTATILSDILPLFL